MSSTKGGPSPMERVWMHIMNSWTWENCLAFEETGEDKSIKYFKELKTAWKLLNVYSTFSCIFSISVQFQILLLLIRITYHRKIIKDWIDHMECNTGEP